MKLGSFTSEVSQVKLNKTKYSSQLLSNSFFASPRLNFILHNLIKPGGVSVWKNAEIQMLCVQPNQFGKSLRSSLWYRMILDLLQDNKKVMVWWNTLLSAFTTEIPQCDVHGCHGIHQHFFWCPKCFQKVGRARWVFWPRRLLIGHWRF